MKKLIAVVMVLLCTSLIFAKEVKETHKTGSYLSYDLTSSLYIKYQYYTGYATRIYSILPYNDGYVLKLSFDDPSYSWPVLELFVKPGMVLETRNSDCPKIRIDDVRPNEIDLTYILPD